MNVMAKKGEDRLGKNYYKKYFQPKSASKKFVYRVTVLFLFWIMHPTMYLPSWVRYPKEKKIRLYLSGLEFSCWTFLHSRSTSVTCNVFDLGKASSRVECHLECQKHWKPINDTTVTTCYPETSRNDHFYGSKLTNFTIDYLECQRMDD